jgi:hypothetical protein
LFPSMMDCRQPGSSQGRAGGASGPSVLRDGRARALSPAAGGVRPLVRDASTGAEAAGNPDKITMLVGSLTAVSWGYAGAPARTTDHQKLARTGESIDGGLRKERPSPAEQSCSSRRPRPRELSTSCPVLTVQGCGTLRTLQTKHVRKRIRGRVNHLTNALYRSLGCIGSRGINAPDRALHDKGIGTAP